MLDDALDTLDGIADKAEKLTKEGIQKLTGLTGFSFFATKAPTHSFANRTATLVYEAGQKKETFLNPIGDDVLKKERFEKFKESFDQISYAGRIARLLDEQPKIREIQSEIGTLDLLVPKQVSEEEFWLRYYFCIAEIELAQQTRADMVLNSGTQEEDFAWSSEGEEEPVVAGDAVKEVADIVDLNDATVNGATLDSTTDTPAVTSETINTPNTDEATPVKVAEESTKEPLEKDAETENVKLEAEDDVQEKIAEALSDSVQSVSNEDLQIETRDQENHDMQSGSSFDIVEKPQISPTTLQLIDKEEEWGGWD
jgi:hypothetical protein